MYEQTDHGNVVWEAIKVGGAKVNIVVVGFNIVKGIEAVLCSKANGKECIDIRDKVKQDVTSGICKDLYWNFDYSYPLAFSVMLSTWMRRKPFFYRLMSAMPRFELKSPANLISGRLCMLLADESLDLDEMSTLRQMKVANYRQVSKMPGLVHILSYLTGDCRKFTRVLCLNLREKAVLEGDGKVYSLREVNNLQQEIIIPAKTVEQLELHWHLCLLGVPGWRETPVGTHSPTPDRFLDECLGILTEEVSARWDIFIPRDGNMRSPHLTKYQFCNQGKIGTVHAQGDIIILAVLEVEAASKMDVLSSRNAIETWHEETKQLKQFTSCNTLQEVYSQIAMQYPQLQYQRIPITDCAVPREEDFDVFLKVVRSNLTRDKISAIILNCRNGKERTTISMVICLILTWHINGFPEPFVEDIVSIPDAKYTRGEFEAILNLVHLLPNGGEMKKEVDRALDAVSDSVTPMMHHLRELIVNTYKKSKGAKDKDIAASLHLRSLQYQYFYLILFDTYLHLEKPGKWERLFKEWMAEVVVPASVFEILDKLGFLEFEDPGSIPMCRMRYRWQKQ
ncbi:LOW QUALITY PROTEIN: paladin-like [Carcharodon carcharias]|uniref:LOW QUALITY PROTEIN: paladin-like n=1 Tax=Carcharodon carcharias TaxID=13397 RepID=UPI001B7F61CD|nr:LOW QUALITY PROTEIN: paladin-like [Carcharodon carcharias]